MAKTRPYKYNSQEKLTRAFDDKSTALLTVTNTHHEIHDGNFYTLDVVAAANAGQAVEILLTPPAAPAEEFHCIWEFSSKGEGNLNLIEDVTSVSGGTVVTPVNNNRNSTNTSVSSNSRTGTPSVPISYTGGTIIHDQHFGSGVTGGRTLSRDNEMLIKAGASTVFRLESEAASNELWLHILWYEYVDQNVQEVNS